MENTFISAGLPSYNGKGKFRWRLAKALQSLGHDIVDNPRLCDIHFRTNALPASQHGKRIVRLDDPCYSREAMHVRNMSKGGNDQIRKAVQKADGIVYQSTVSQRMCEAVVGIHNKQNMIIPNGVDPDDFQPSCIPLRGRKNYLMACQFLHPLRRLPRLLECWDQFVKDKDDAFLHIVYGESIGDPRISDHKNIEILPLLKQPDLNNLISSCDVAIFIKFQDSCPNLAAEVLACGTPLIVNETNGILESVDHQHVTVVPIDGPYQFGMRDWKEPPFRQGETLLEALETIYKEDKRRLDFPPKLHIMNVAKRYADFFEEVLRT